MTNPKYKNQRAYYHRNKKYYADRQRTKHAKIKQSKVDEFIKLLLSIENTAGYTKPFNVVYEEPYHYKPRKKTPGVCPTCGKEFYGRLGKVYCRDRCSPSYKEPRRMRKRIGEFRSKVVPRWCDKKWVTNFYINCPEGYEVDHILPLNHPDICGLHNQFNLQYLLKEENVKKSNRFDWSYDNKNY